MRSGMIGRRAVSASASSAPKATASASRAVVSAAEKNTTPTRFCLICRIPCPCSGKTKSCDPNLSTAEAA